MVVSAVVGFVPCEDKHRVKAAVWQRFVYSLTLNADICSDAFSCAEKAREGPARDFAEHRQSRPLVAPHQVPPAGRRRKKSAASDQVRSFAAKRAQSAQIHPAR